jgi:hypothetical protein
MSDKIIPPGKLLSNPNFNLDYTVVRFERKRPAEPLPPIVQTSISGDYLQVSANVFIAKKAMLDKDNPDFSKISLQVYFNGNVLQPGFYITYNARETEDTEFYVSQVNFFLSVTEDLKGLIPSTIYTEVWDEDPVASRGTITNVL